MKKFRVLVAFRWALARDYGIVWLQNQTRAERPKENKMQPYKTQAHINSLNGQMDEITVLEKAESTPQTTYMVDYKGTKCTATFNCITGSYYADDVYGKIK